MRTILRILLPLALIAAALFAADNYVEFFAKSPALVLAGCLIAFVAHLPSLRVTRRLDRQPMRWAVFAAAIGFVMAFAPITSEVTWGVINRGVRYWQIVGMTEELTKMLPVLLALVYAPRLVRNTRDGLVLGARHARPHPLGRGDWWCSRLPRGGASQSQALAARAADDPRGDVHARPAGPVRQVHRATGDRRARTSSSFRSCGSRSAGVPGAAVLCEQPLGWGARVRCSGRRGPMPRLPATDVRFSDIAGSGEFATLGRSQTRQPHRPWSGCHLRRGFPATSDQETNVKRFVIAVAATLVAGSASAAVPLFAAKCGQGITADSNAKGQVYVNGKVAKLINRPDGQITAQSGGVYVDITPQGNQPPRVTYTAKDKSFGACEIVSFAPPAGHSAAAPAGGGHRASASERAGQGRFDANGPVRCAQRAGQPMGQCQAAVARDPGGTATIVITRPDGRKRFIFFENGNPVSADLSQADGNMEFRGSKGGDVYYIQAGDERYEIVEAFVYGG